MKPTGEISILNKLAKKAIFWTPRILCIVFALFVSLFALDVFVEGFNSAETTIALLMHMIPTAIIVIALISFWRWEWIRAFLFIVLSVFYPIWTRGKFPWITYAVMSGPIFIAGVLFHMNWVYKAELKTDDLCTTA